MDRALLDLQTGQVVPYPRADSEPVVGLDPRYSVLSIVRAAEPEYDPATQQLTPNRAVVGDEWRWGWTVEDLPPPQDPGPDYVRFYNELIASNVYAGVVSMPDKTGDQAFAATVFATAALEANNGRVNPPAFQSAILLLLSQIQLTTEDMAELQALMNATGLSAVYSLVPG